MAMMARPVRIAALPHARQPATSTRMRRPGSRHGCNKHFCAPRLGSWIALSTAYPSTTVSAVAGTATAAANHVTLGRKRTPNARGEGFMLAYAKTGAFIALLLAIGAGEAR